MYPKWLIFLCTNVYLWNYFNLVRVVVTTVFRYMKKDPK